MSRNVSIRKPDPETKWTQCSSMYSGRTSTVFCVKASGHTGDHRGSRAQWNASGQKVPITEEEEL